jgi:hypothetical protein
LYVCNQKGCGRNVYMLVLSKKIRSGRTLLDIEMCTSCQSILSMQSNIDAGLRGPTAYTRYTYIHPNLWKRRVAYYAAKVSTNVHIFVEYRLFWTYSVKICRTQVCTCRRDRPREQEKPASEAYSDVSGFTVTFGKKNTNTRIHEIFDLFSELFD